MNEQEQRAAMLKAREQAKREYQKLKEQERANSPHIPKAHKKGKGFLFYFVCFILVSVMVLGLSLIHI